MKAAWYERNGPARDVLTVGEMDAVEPADGEVRVRLHASGVNPSDVKSRAGRPLIAPRIVPHSDGAGVIDATGKGSQEIGRIDGLAMREQGILRGGLTGATDLGVAEPHSGLHHAGPRDAGGVHYSKARPHNLLDDSG